MLKLIRTLVFAVLICALLCGCAADNPAPEIAEQTPSTNVGEAIVGDIPVEFPLSSMDASLNILAGGYGSIDQKDVYVWQQYEKMTGVDVNWTTVKRDERKEAVYTALVNSQPLDIIMRCKIGASTLVQYGESGLILDLAENDLLKTYAPNCWAYLEAHPDTLASVMNPDGTIYALPQVNSGAELRVALKLFVNKTWLEKCDLQLPKTTDEFREMLVAFRQQDPNGNGDVNDEIPLCCADYQSVQLALYGAFGLADRGFHNTSVDCDPDTGDVRLVAASPAYKQYLEYMHGLYDETLLDSSVFTITDDQWASNAQNDRIGVFASTNLARLPADKLDNWIAIEEPLEGPSGDKLWTAIRANFHSTGAAVIPATCADPALALRWLDYFWTDAGTLFYHMGIEGETFTRSQDGTYDYTQAIYDEIAEGNHSFDDVVATYSPYPGGSNPTVEIAPYFMGGEMADVPKEAARKLFEYGPEEYWPEFTFTVEESEILGTVRSDITKLVNAAQVEFITGTRSFDDWDEYLSQIEDIGMEKMLDVYRAAINRYHALITELD